MHYLSLLCADGKAKVVAIIRELVNAVLHASLCGSFEGTVIGEQEVVGFHLKPAEVEDGAISPVLDADADASLKASVSMAENMRLNRVGARTQPCFTPFETGNGSEVSPLSWTLASMPLCSCRTMAMNFLGHPYFAMIPQRPSLLTVSKALVRST